jgi:hypothetical protein
LDARNNSKERLKRFGLDGDGNTTGAGHASGVSPLVDPGSWERQF